MSRAQEKVGPKIYMGFRIIGPEKITQRVSISREEKKDWGLITGPALTCTSRKEKEGPGAETDKLPVS